MLTERALRRRMDRFYRSFPRHEYDRAPLGVSLRRTGPFGGERWAVVVEFGYGPPLEVEGWCLHDHGRTVIVGGGPTPREALMDAEHYLPRFVAKLWPPCAGCPEAGAQDASVVTCSAAGRETRTMPR